MPRAQIDKSQIKDASISAAAISAPGLTNGLFLTADSSQTDGLKWSSGITGSGVATQLAIFDSASDLLSDANLAWNASKSSLVIGGYPSDLPITIPSVEVISQGTNGVGFIATSFSTSSGHAGFVGLRAGGTVASPLPTQSSTKLVSFSGAGHDGTAFDITHAGGEMHFLASETWSPTAHGTTWLLDMCPVGSTAQLNVMYASPENGGQVGIGRAPGTEVDAPHGLVVSAGVAIVDDGSGNGLVRVISYGGNSSAFVGYSAQGTEGSPTATLNGDVLAFHGGKGHDGTSFTTHGSRVAISMVAEEDWTPTAQGTRMIFRVTNNGTTSNLNAMILASTGFLGIGSGTPASLLSVGALSAFQVNAAGDIVSLHGVPVTFPSSHGTAGYVLSDSDGAGTLAWVAQTGGGGGGGGSEYRQDYLATAAQTDFVLTAPHVFVPGSGNASVFRNGLIQTIGGGNDYIEVGNDTIRFNSGLLLNDKVSIEVITSGGVPAGSDTQIQFNSLGAFGASSALSWDQTNASLIIGNSPSNLPGLVPSVEAVGDGIAAGFVATVFRNSGDTSLFAGLRAGGSVATPAATPSGVHLVSLTGIGHDGTAFDFSNSGGEVKFNSTELWTPSAHGTNFDVTICPSGSTSREQVIFALDTGSGLLLGIGNSSPAAMLSVGSSSQFQVDGSGNVTSQGNVTALQFTDTITTVTVTGASTSIVASAGAIIKVNLNTSTTISFSSPPVLGQTVTLMLKQGGGGSNTVTWTSVLWPGGTPPVLTSTVGKTDVISLFYDGTNYYGFVGGLNY